MSDSITTLRGGEVETTETPSGVLFRAFNFERGQMLHIGTLKGSVYEKEAAVLLKPEPSFSFPKAELTAIEAYNGRFICIIPTDHSGTFAISVRDFRRHAKPYDHPKYGPQLRVKLERFNFCLDVRRRNPILDNPPVEIDDPLAVGRKTVEPLWKSLDLFSR